LGTGFPKCIKLIKNVKQAISELIIEAEIVKVIDIQEIMSFGVMITPKLAIDREVKIARKVVSDIKNLFS
jgi:small redox-active disulfide protein 2